ncbi:MAG: PAS domain S-box protein [Arcobacteraceae bacterium]|nr:PAS domain S-box protein [Arcobacteraceae bacterium]
MEQLDTSSLRKSVTFSIVMTIFILIVIIIAITDLVNRYSHEQHERKHTTQVNNSIKQVITHYNKEYTYITKRFIKTTALTELLKKRDREGIYKLFKPKWDLMTEEEPYLAVMHFHLKDGSSFLRMHKPEIFGDNLIHIRPMIKEIHYSHKQISGYETGKYGSLYRIITPIFDANQTYIGAIELGLNLNFIIRELNEINDMNGLIFIKDDKLKFFSNPIDLVIDGYRLQSKPVGKLKVISTMLTTLNYQEHDVTLLANDKQYQIHIFTLNGFQGQPKIKILIFHDILEIWTLEWLLLAVQLVLILISLALLAWFVYRRISIYENNIKHLYDEQMKQLNESEHLLADSQRITHVGSWKHDIVSNMIFWSNESYRIFEIDPEKFAVDYEIFLDLIHPDDRKMVKLGYSNSLKNKTLYNLVYRILMKDGRIKFVQERCGTTFDADGKALVSIGTVQDITEQRQLQNELELNRNYLQSIFDMSPNIMITTDGGEIIEANNAMLEFTGFKTLEAFKRKHQCICDFFEKEKKCLNPDMKGIRWLEYILSKPTKLHHVCMMRGGKKYRFIVRAKLLDMEDVRRSVVTFTDVTEIEEVKEQLEYAINGAKDGLWDWNLETDEVYFAAPWKRMLGYEDDEITNELHEWSDRVHPDDLKQAYEDIHASNAKPDIPYQNIHRLRHKGGYWIWVLDRGQTIFDQNGKAVRMIGYKTDISELKNLGEQLSQINKTLLENEEKLLAITSSMQDAIIMLDSKGKLVFWNPKAKEMLGYDEEEFKGKDFHEIVVPKVYYEAYKKAYSKFASSGKGDAIGKRMDVEAVRKGGIEFPVSLSLNSVQIKNQWHGIGIMRDITEQKKLEAELKSKEELMLTQSRHAAMGEMISMIAHQWRQPISIIAMGANNILVDIEFDNLNNEMLQQYANEIVNQTLELSKTIDDFRNFFKPIKMIEEVLVIDVVEDAFSVIGKSLENNDIEVIRLFNNNKKIQTYSRELMQVLINIFKNSKEALIDTEEQNSACRQNNNNVHKKIFISVEEGLGTVVIRICDNAGGISENIKEKIFEPYFSTKDEKGGTGLGLYMSKTIVEKHLNGTLITYNKDGGACFEIELPCILK